MIKKKYIWSCKQCQKPFESSTNFAELSVQEIIEAREKDETFEFCNDCEVKYWEKIYKEDEEYMERHCSKCDKEYTPYTDVPEDFIALIKYEKEKGSVGYCESCRKMELSKRKKKENVEFFFVTAFCVIGMAFWGMSLGISPIKYLLENPNQPWFIWIFAIVAVPIGLFSLFAGFSLGLGAILVLFKKILMLFKKKK